MDPDQQQSQLLTQPVPAGAAPAVRIDPAAPGGLAAALGTYPPPPDMTRGDVVIQIMSTAMARGMMLGLKCGAAYGAFCGLYGLIGFLFVLITVPIGAFTGLVIGFVAGLVLGFVEGLILGVISATCFYPLRSWTPYREIMGAVSVLVVLVPLLLDVFYAGIGARFYGNSGPVWILVQIPLLISCVCALFASRRVVDEYAARVGVAPGSLPYNLDTVDIYDPSFQQMLFDRLQRSYTTVAYIASFGLLSRWRRRLVALIDLQPDARVCDLMSGTGALWSDLLPRLGPAGRLIGIEHSPTMVQAGQAKLRALADPRVELRLGNALNTGLPAGSVSVVTCGFGPMLFNSAQVSILADEIARILDDHGVVALVDLRMPDSGLLRKPYLFYLRWIVPLVALGFGGNPILYGTLARFVEQSSATQQLEFLLAQRGFQLFHYRFSGGVATALVGMKLWKSHNL